MMTTKTKVRYHKEICKEPNHFPGYNIRVFTPEGTIYVHISEDKRGNPCHLFVSAGKSGWPLQGMATAISNMIVELWKLGVHTSKIISTIDITPSDRYSMNSNGIKIYSMPHGIQWALIQYIQLKSHNVDL